MYQNIFKKSYIIGSLEYSYNFASTKLSLLCQLFPKDKFLDIKLLGEKTCTFLKLLIYTSNCCKKVCNNLRAHQ